MGRAAFVGWAAVVAVALGLLVAAGCDDDPSASSEPSVAVELNETPMSDADAAAVDEVVAGIVSLPELRKEYPAFWIGVWDPDKGAFLGAYGEAEKGGAAATADDHFRIGSISKTFTATVILRMVDDGELTLAQTIEEADPDLAAAHPEIADVTIRQLLSMRSGIPDYLNVPDGGIIDRVVADPSTVITADELIDAGVKGGVKPPGTGGYSTTNYIILQRIAETVSGSTIQQLVADEVTGPLGMGTVFPDWEDPALPDPSSHGYINAACVDEFAGDGAGVAEGTDTTTWNVTSSQGGGGGYATLRDLGIWAASVDGSALLSDGLADARLETKPIAEGLDYGLGVYRVGDWVGHAGEVFGWEAEQWHDPTTGVTIAMATNACAGGSGIMDLLRDELYPGAQAG